MLVAQVALCHLFEIKGIMFLACAAVLFVRSSDLPIILFPRCLVNGLSNFDKTDREYSLASTDDLIRVWRSKARGQGQKHTLVKICGGEGMSKVASIDIVACYFFDIVAGVDGALRGRLVW